MKSIIKQARLKARARRTHAKARIAQRPRLVVFRSGKAIYAQIIDDIQNKVLCGTSSLKSKKSGIEAAAEVGKALAEMAKKAKVTEVAFDRNGYQYHGQVKALAEAAREGGLKF